MHTDVRPLTAGKFIVAAVLLTVIFSVDITWGGFEFPYKGYVLFALQVGFLFVAFVTGVWAKRGVKRRVLMHPVFLLWVMLFLFALGSSMVQADTWTIVKQSVLIILPRLLLALAVLHDPNPEATFYRFSKGFVLLMVAAVALGFLVLSFGEVVQVVDDLTTKRYVALDVGPITTKVPFSRYGLFTRFAAPVGYGNPNAVGALLLTSILLTILLSSSRFWSKRLGFGLLLIQFLAFAGTLSRTAWVSFIPAMVVLLALTARSLSRLVTHFSYLFLGLVVASFVALWDNSVLSLALERTVERGVTGRDLFWSVGLKQLSNSPLFGIGFGMASETVSHLSGSAGGLHGTWLQQAVELGLPGLFILMAMFVWTALSAVSVLVQRGGPNLSTAAASGVPRLFRVRNIIIFGVAMITAIGIHSLAESALFYNSAAGFTWTYLLVATAAMVGLLHRS